MSTILKYALKLTSDAEPGSGTGGEVVNDLVARDHAGNPVLRATHIKGLLRQVLDDIIDVRGWPDEKALCDWCFGDSGNDGPNGVLAFSDATVSAGGTTRAISRTSLNELGTAAGTTLRTTEAVATGTVFQGTVRLLPDAPADVQAAVDTAIRLGLLSLTSVGGGRTRGVGACLVCLEAETRSPADLLRELDKVMQAGLKPREGTQQIDLGTIVKDVRPVTLALQFFAEQPVCCPEQPIGSSNAIESGIAIPASAVLGAVISRLSRKDPDLATRTLASTATRAWPLLPSAVAGDEPAGLPVHVALSHRMSKLPGDDARHVFRDGAIEPYDWRTASPGSPLKGADGVLLRSESGTIKLWKSGDMPRMVTAHNVVNSKMKRNLFTVSAMAPMVYTGWITLPVDAVEALQAELAQDGAVSFGKSRTVRGNGILRVEKSQASLPAWSSQIFVLQSPAAIPDDWDTANASAENLLARLVRESGMGEVASKAGGKGTIEVVSLAQGGVRFGWNRHGIGEGVQETRRLRARRVFLPGSVFKLSAPAADLQALLVRGLGVNLPDGDVDGRLQGFGALLPHPGCATEPLVTKPEHPVLHSNKAASLALKWKNAAGSNKPSASQISAVAERLADKARGKDEVLKYLKQQQMRPGKIWQRWDRVIGSIEDAIGKQPEVALDALRIWRDMAVSGKEEN